MERKDFIKKAALRSFATLLGTSLVFGSYLKEDYTPVAIDGSDRFDMFNKNKSMIVLND